jgi:modulator of FtsH protease
VLHVGYVELFAATAGAAAALTGLLFVAMSVAPRRRSASVAPVIQQVRAAAALLSFTNVLVVALFSLVPGTHVGYPALIMGLSGLLFTAGAGRSIVSSQIARRDKMRQVGLVVLLVLIFGTELISGLILLGNTADASALEAVGYALVASLISGVARAWELVGDRDTGILASIVFLSGHHPAADAPEETASAAAEPRETGPPADRDAAAEPAGGAADPGTGPGR